MLKCLHHGSCDIMGHFCLYCNYRSKNHFFLMGAGQKCSTKVESQKNLGWKTPQDTIWFNSC